MIRTQRVELAVRRSPLCWLAIGCAAVVLYGSLLPLQIRWLPLMDVMRAYAQAMSSGNVRFSRSDFATNVALFIPLAFVSLGCLRARGRGIWTVAMVLAGCGIFSATIEWLQIIFPPRSSSMYDVLANLMGAMFGVAAWEIGGARLCSAVTSAAQDYHVSDATHLRLVRFARAASLPYIVAVGTANGWLSSSWLTPEVALARIETVSLIPFRYVQEANIGVGIASMIGQCGLYVPFGCFCRVFDRERCVRLHRLVRVAAWSAAFACLIETGKLFLRIKRPDVSDIALAAAGAALGYMVWPLLSLRDRLRAQGTTSSNHLDPAPITRGSRLARGVALVSGTAVVLGLTSFPVASAPLAVALCLYALVLVRWPHAWLWVLPVGSVVIDLESRSGWFFLDEIDLLILTTLAIGLWRWRSTPSASPVRRAPGIWFLVPFAASLLISVGIGLLPWQPLDWNAFASYYSHYNSLRVAKGFVWVAMLAPLLWASAREGVDVFRALTGGMVTALAGTVLLAIRERYVYAGLFDYAMNFRIGAFFPGMHMGGSDIETLLVLATPMLLLALWDRRAAFLRVILGLLFIATTYTMMVTYSRAGYAAYAVVLIVMGIAIVRAAGTGTWRRSGILGGWIVLGLVTAYPILFGSFSQQRIGTLAADFDYRVAHWKDALHMMDRSAASAIFGMGLGRYPELYFFRNQEGKQPATFRYEEEAGNTYLKLGSGDPLYVEQIVDIAPGKVYRLALDIRTSVPGAAVNVLLCERTYFNSYGCAAAQFEELNVVGQWTHHRATLATGKLGAGAWPLRRQAKLLLEDPKRGTSVDLDNVALIDDDGNNLVANGDFARGNARWYFSSRDHLPWHVKSVAIATLFEQGWLGLCGFVTLMLFAFARLARRAWHFDAVAAAGLAAMLGYLTVGAFGSLFESPRLTTLFFLVLLASGALLALPGRTVESLGARAAPRFSAGGATPWSSGVAADAPIAATLDVPQTSVTPVRMTMPLVVSIGVLAVAIAIATQSPLMPYNVRDLPNPAHPWAAPLVLAVFLYWICATPALMAFWLIERRDAKALLPIALLLHGIIAWGIVRYGVYPVMIHKVTGTPVLGWPWDWETLLRFAVLEGTLFLCLTGGALMVGVSAGAHRSAAAIWAWALWSATWLPLAYWVIVINAATDNLTELMAGGGTPSAGVAIAAWMILVGLSGSTLAATAGRRRLRLVFTLFIIPASIPLGFALLWVGTESAVEKYGAVFSALQFLLSSSRDQYAGPVELAVRYLVFHGGLMVAIALAQYPLWRSVRRHQHVGADRRLLPASPSRSTPASRSPMHDAESDMHERGNTNS